MSFAEEIGNRATPASLSFELGAFTDVVGVVADGRCLDPAAPQDHLCGAEGVRFGCAWTGRPLPVQIRALVALSATRHPCAVERGQAHHHLDRVRRRPLLDPRGDAIIHKIDLTLVEPGTDGRAYEAEHATCAAPGRAMTFNRFGQRSKYAPNIDYVTVGPLLG